MIKLTQDLTTRIYKLEKAFLKKGYTNEYALLAVFRCMMISDIHNRELAHAGKKAYI